MSSAVSSAPSYLTVLSKLTTPLVTTDGYPIDVWELIAPADPSVLSDWAKHFRQHYCSDSEIDPLRSGTGLSRADFLIQLLFPDSATAPGPSIRAGDFAEILVSDYVEYVLGYWVPRDKYAAKESRDESVKGTDILGFRVATAASPALADTLLAFEVKAQLSGGKYSGRLQTAIDDSSKDYLRRAITLNATKRRLLRAGEKERAFLVERFQNPSDHPYTYRSGAAAILSDGAYDVTLVNANTKAAGHQNASSLELIVIRGTNLMTLVHSLYERGANEA